MSARDAIKRTRTRRLSAQGTKLNLGAPPSPAQRIGPYTLEFVLPGLPKMSNQLLRGHWRVKHAHAMKWKLAVSLACHGRKPLKPLAKARVTIIRHSSVEPDYDGLVSSGKPLLDGLVECGVLIGDKMSVIGRPVYDWIKAPKGKGRVTIKVEEIP